MILDTSLRRTVVEQSAISEHQLRIMILRYLEESSLYNEIGPTRAGGASNWNPQTWAVELYLCPSAERPISNGTTLVVSHYAAVSGAYRGSERDDLEDVWCGDIYKNGIFYPESNTKITRITDGTSHTLAVGERLYTFFDWMDGATYLGKLPTPTRICTDAAKNVRYPINSDPRTVGYYVDDPNAPTGASKTLLMNDLFFSSQHPGGANFCLADGSVQFVRDTIDFIVFQDLATKSGEEIVQEGF